MEFIIAKDKDQYDMWTEENCKVHNVDCRFAKSMVMLTGFITDNNSIRLLKGWKESTLFNNPYAMDFIEHMMQDSGRWVINEEATGSCSEHGYSLENGDCPECKRMREGTSNIILE